MKGLFRFFYVSILILIYTSLIFAQSVESPFEGIWRRDTENFYTFTGNNVLFNTIFAPGAPRSILRGIFSINNDSITFRFKQISLDQGNSWMGVAQNAVWNITSQYRISGNNLFINSIRYVKQTSGQSNPGAQTNNPENDFRVSAIELEGRRGGVIMSYSGSLRDVVIPPVIQNFPIITIGGNSFDYKQLTSVVIPDGVIVIGREAFEGNRLTSLNIPDSVNTIWEWAFAGNPITSITIGANVFLRNLIAEPFEYNFSTFYNSNNKRAGTYLYRNNQWSFTPR